MCTEVEDAEDLKKALIEGGWVQIRYTRVLRRASPTRQSGSGKEESSARRCCNARLPTVIKRPVGVLFVQVRFASAMKTGSHGAQGGGWRHESVVERRNQEERGTDQEAMGWEQKVKQPIGLPVS